MNKKGFLLGEETLKIVLAVIAIGFLVFFLVSLYFSQTKDKDLELAEASLEYLIEGINSGNQEVEIYNPVGGVIGLVEKNWFILSWSSEGIIPNTCLNIGWEDCICICEGGGSKTERKFAERCDEEGICLENDFKIEGNDNYIKIEDPPLILTINYEDETITKKDE